MCKATINLEASCRIFEDIFYKRHFCEKDKISTAKFSALWDTKFTDFIFSHFFCCFLIWSSLWHRKIVKLRDGIVKLTSDVQINSISLMKYLFWIVRKDLFIQPLISV